MVRSGSVNNVLIHQLAPQFCKKRSAHIALSRLPREPSMLTGSLSSMRLNSFSVPNEAIHRLL